MDDFVAALLCLPFLILPAIVLVAIISSKIRASQKAMCVAIPGLIGLLAALWLKGRL